MPKLLVRLRSTYGTCYPVYRREPLYIEDVSAVIRSTLLPRLIEEIYGR